ncbi:hypothetical protein CRUP_029305 [Coryphaenoides rupestris]|nr:hypothetical protein CRUP_029305 [Coryphaenoides rupestris]
MEGLEDYDVYEDYTPDNETSHKASVDVTGTFDATKSFLEYAVLALNIIVCLVGLGGNAVVIWISGWKMRRTVNTTFYLSLAISDFLFCACLPLDIAYVMASNWHFGAALCKLASSVLFLNMFSSVFVLVLISVDRCVMVAFPVWSQNHRTVWMASVALVLTWLLSAALTLPSLLYRSTRVHGATTQCYSDYRRHSVHKAVVLNRFFWGFLVPFALIVSCTFVLCVKLRRLTIRSTKPYKVMVGLILPFFFCWIPYHTFVFLDLDVHKHNLNVVRTGLVVGTTLAATNSLMNPFLYVFIGREFKQTLRRSFMTRMEYAMAEDLRTSTPASKTMGVEAIASTPIASQSLPCIVLH